jgi:hypothetical protein
MSGNRRIEPGWERKAVVEVICDACSREGSGKKRRQLLAQVVRRPNGLFWLTYGTRRLPAAQRRATGDRDLERKIDLPMPKTPSEAREFFTVLCWRHGAMLAPADELERESRTSITTTVGVSPELHRYAEGAS